MIIFQILLVVILCLFVAYLIYKFVKMYKEDKELQDRKEFLQSECDRLVREVAESMKRRY